MQKHFDQEDIDSKNILYEKRTNKTTIFYNPYKPTDEGINHLAKNLKEKNVKDNHYAEFPTENSKLRNIKNRKNKRNDILNCLRSSNFEEQPKYKNFAPRRRVIRDEEEFDSMQTTVQQEQEMDTGYTSYSSGSSSSETERKKKSIGKMKDSQGQWWFEYESVRGNFWFNPETKFSQFNRPDEKPRKTDEHPKKPDFSNFKKFVEALSKKQSKGEDNKDLKGRKNESEKITDDENRKSCSGENCSDSENKKITINLGKTSRKDVGLTFSVDCKNKETIEIKYINGILEFN